MAKRIAKVWNGTTPINGIPAEEVLAQRDDIRRNLNDVFIVEDGYGNVTEIQFGRTIKANYQMDPELTLDQVAAQYLVEREKEEAAQAEEQITHEQLQSQVAALQFEVMMMQPEAPIAKTMMMMVGAEGHSAWFESVRIYYKKGFWTKEMVKMAVVKERITAEEYKEIVGEDYVA